MIRKSQRLFRFEQHKQTGQKLARINHDFRQVLSSLRGSSKVLDVAVKADSWFNRLRVSLDSMLLKDWPEDYSASVYFPPEPESASPLEPISEQESVLSER